MSVTCVGWVQRKPRPQLPAPSPRMPTLRHEMTRTVGLWRYRVRQSWCWEYLGRVTGAIGVLRGTHYADKRWDL